MDLLSRLPVECLQHILRILNNDDDFSALARLLLMNKHIASATLPFLYRDPFRLKPDQEEVWKRRHSRPKYYDKLTRMLLSRLPLATLPKVVLLAFVADSTDSFPATTTSTATSSNLPLDYHAHIRHLNIPSLDREELRWSNLSSLINSQQSAYIQSVEFDQSYQSNPFLPIYATHVGDKGSILRWYYQVVLYHEALWNLAHPFLGQLQSLSIPMHYFDRFHNVVHRFQNLELVHFMTSDVFEPNFDEGADTDSESDDRIDKRKAVMQRRDELVQEMRRFVQDHIQLFKGRLKSVRCLEDKVWENTKAEYTNQFRREIYRLLPPLCNPTRLTHDNWLQFSVHAQVVDLAHVREFSSDKMPKTWEDIVCNSQSILQRCRALERLQIHTVRAGAFKWAVLEKNGMEQGAGRSAMVRNDCVGRRMLGQDETSSLAHRIHHLVPLKVVSIYKASNMGTDDIDDILFAFNHTLRVLSIVENVSMVNRIKLHHIGQGLVHLPALTSLNLSLSSERLVLDRGLLSHCPNLTFLHLRDFTLTYSCRDIVPCLPARLDQLGVLQLVGWPALTLDPATLASTTRLRSLIMDVYPWYIGHGAGPRGFIPPVEELYLSYGIQDGAPTPPPSTASTIATDLGPGTIRPCWTWDWYLPHLTRLDLKAEFAYLFEFKMLRGCPALTALYLSITSTIPGTHTRVISESDLFLPTSASIRSNSDSGSCSNDSSSNDRSGSPPPTQQQQSTHEQRQRLFSPSVTSLSLQGDWAIDQEIMPQFLAGMFPNVNDIYIAEWNLSSKEALVRMFRDMSTKYGDSLLNVNMLAPSSYEMARLGIVAYREDADPKDHLSVKLLNMANLDEYRLLKTPPSFP
ncbi:MAG: hypothetical protein JOS17DRAFT_833787 [Linnemannia elongata]|nr:MAG: hypothetical protein JOS17DRAFT_833787 [Linnemannia elongata]